MTTEQKFHLVISAKEPLLALAENTEDENVANILRTAYKILTVVADDLHDELDQPKTSPSR